MVQLGLKRSGFYRCCRLYRVRQYCDTASYIMYVRVVETERRFRLA